MRQPLLTLQRATPRRAKAASKHSCSHHSTRTGVFKVSQPMNKVQDLGF